MNNRRKIGIFGGTFNPVHNGHLRLAKMYYNELCLDEIIVIPTNIPPHKDVDNSISSEDRLHMLELAFKDLSYVTVSDIELRSEGKNYTILTLEKLLKIYPDDELFLIVGGDMFLCFEEWKEYKKILSSCTVCTAPREKGEIQKLLEYQNKIDPQKKCTIVLNAPVLELSSSEIRSKAAQKTGLKELVPEDVFEYIVEKGLYNDK